MWLIKSFEDLTATELYGILQLRATVFVVEQNCVYNDLDDKDKKAQHIFYFDYKKGMVLAHARILPAGASYEEISIGRVVTHPSVRKTGMGKELMQETLSYINRHFGNEPIRIGAQTYLTLFYESFGFVPCSKEYLEDGIPHIEMLKKAPKSSLPFT